MSNCARLERVAGGRFPVTGPAADGVTSAAPSLLAMNMFCSIVGMESNSLAGSSSKSTGTTKAATDAVQMIANALGADIVKFLELYSVCGPWGLQDAIKAIIKVEAA